MSSVTGSVVAFARDAAYDAARGHALVRTLVDTVGVALPGAASGTVATLDRWAETAPSPGNAVVWGRYGTVSASRAALINGTAAHALDFDDASPTSPLHASAVLWPAVLAQAGARGSTWPEVLEAVDVGQAVLRAILDVLPGDVHYARGWHSTATVGRLGAIAALVRLGGLDDTTARHALGIGATFSSGLRRSFGSMSKPLHAGLAARDAVDAVGLALAGMTAGSDALDGPGGFLDVFGHPVHDAAIDERLAHWASAWPGDCSVKRYPSCYGTHRAVDAALALHARLGHDAAAATRVVVEIHPASLQPLVDHAPITPLEAKFSLEHTVASALLDGDLALASFTDDAVRRPAVVALRERVLVVPTTDPVGGPDLGGAGFARVRVESVSGADAVLVTITRGDARDPLTDAELDTKLRTCAAGAGWADSDTETLLSALRAAGSTTGTAPAFDALRRAAGRR